MAELDDDWNAPPLPCVDCGKPLDGNARKHGIEGFGHYRRCCACYDRRQHGLPVADKPWRP